MSILKKKLRGVPAVIIAAEIYPLLRRIACAEHGFREDEQWGYLNGGTKASYVKDVWSLDCPA